MTGYQDLPTLLVLRISSSVAIYIGRTDLTLRPFHQLKNHLISNMSACALFFSNVDGTHRWANVMKKQAFSTLFTVASEPSPLETMRRPTSQRCTVVVYKAAGDEKHVANALQRVQPMPASARWQFSGGGVLYAGSGI